MPFVIIDTNDAIVMRECIDKFMAGRRGRKPIALVRLRDDLAKAVSTEDSDLVTYGICDPSTSGRYWISPRIVETVWEALNIYAYDAGPCPCGDEDDEGRCIIRRYEDYVSQPTLRMRERDASFHIENGLEVVANV